MIGRRKVLALRTELGVGLSESKCSHGLCHPRTLPPYAVRRTVGVGCVIEETGSRQALPHKRYWKNL